MHIISRLKAFYISLPVRAFSICYKGYTENALYSLNNIRHHPYKDVVKALKAVNVPVVAITDFDLLNSSQNFKPLANAFGINWETELFPNMKVVYDSMNAKNSNGNDSWAQIKKIGKAGFVGDEPEAYDKVEKLCKSKGLFVVPVGEMECFDKTVNREKKDWVYYVLENYDLANEAKLEDARKFVRLVCDFKIEKNSAYMVE